MMRWITLALVLGCATPAAAQQQATPAPAARAEAALDAGKPKEAIAIAEQAIKENGSDAHAWFVLARARQANGDMKGAIAAGHSATEFAAVRASAFYNLACAYALSGNKDDAFRALQGAKLAGFADRDLMAKDADLASLRSDPRFVLPMERNYFTLKLKSGQELAYSVDLPAGFDPRKAHPVLVAPGHGRKVDGNWGGLFWGEDTAQRGWITVETASFLSEEPIHSTHELFDDLAKRYRVAGGKFHLACYGPTSGPAFGIAIGAPTRVASLWALPGFPTTDKEADLKKLVGIKVTFIVGDRDPYWYQETTIAHDRLKRLGVECYLEVVPGAGHLLQEMFGGEFAKRLDLMRGTP